MTVGGITLTAWVVDTARWGWLPDWLVDRIWWVPVAVACYSVVKLVVAPRWRYRVYRWEVTADVVYTRKGWISRTWQLVPITRLQTVDHTQGWLERLLDLATVEIQTASHAGSSTIKGLPEAQARQLSEELAARAGQLRSDAT